jgi:predicted O-methyltransferase YrrM
MNSVYEFTSDWFSRRIPLWQEWLRPLVGKPHLQFLEIGSHEGRSALWLLDNVLTHPTGTISCIDPWYNAEAERRFDRNVAASGRSNQVRTFKSKSQQILPRFPERSLDLVYIDGSHEGADVLLDGLLALLLVKRGGLLIFDDYHWKPPDGTIHHPPQPAIDAILDLNDWRLTEVHRGWQIAVRVDR